MHCEDCAKKIKRAMKRYEGVEDVKTDCGANKLTVTGNVDPAKVRDRLAEKISRKVDLISPQPKKDAAPAAAAGGDKKPDDEKKPEEKKEEKKPPAKSTVVRKIKTHCDGCIHKIQKMILKVQGVESTKLDRAKDLVTVKDKEKEVAAEEKKEDGGETEMEVNKMEYHGYEYPSPPMYWSGGPSSTYVVEEYQNHHPHHEYGGSSWSYAAEEHHNPHPHHEYGGPSSTYVVEGYQNHQPHHEYGGPSWSYAAEGYGYSTQGYMSHPGYGSMVDPQHQFPALQMFSDENPNACSIM